MPSSDGVKAVAFRSRKPASTSQRIEWLSAAQRFRDPSQTRRPEGSFLGGDFLLPFEGAEGGKSIEVLSSLNHLTISHAVNVVISLIVDVPVGQLHRRHRLASDIVPFT